MRKASLQFDVSAMPASAKQAILAYYKSDMGIGDITSSSVLPRAKITAIIKAEENGTLAGALEARFLLAKLGINIIYMKKDGSQVEKGETVLKLQGDCSKILSAERTLLNFLTRLSGIATQTSKLAKKSRATLAATRKTMLNFSDKRAVALGKGATHRLGLFDMVLIKDNHIDIVAKEKGISRLAAIPLCLSRAKAGCKGRKIEIEVKNYNEALAAAQGKPNIIMLDKLPVAEVRKIARCLKGSGICIEASGGINESNIAAYGNSGVDYISLGSLTNACRPLDMSLEVVQ